MNTEELHKSILSVYKPILIVYIPIEIYKNKNAVLQVAENLKSDTEEMYIILTVPSYEDSIKIDLLSVLKNKIISDDDLHKYLKYFENGLRAKFIEE